ncbi:hypothetical protein FGB62_247g01 [Gracilaria domingensis]|nr:hypothetical protein FGB62_247g01 [Gracilaria domingensis]
MSNTVGVQILQSFENVSEAAANEARGQIAHIGELAKHVARRSAVHDERKRQLRRKEVEVAVNADGDGERHGELSPNGISKLGVGENFDGEVVGDTHVRVVELRGMRGGFAGVQNCGGFFPELTLDDVARHGVWKYLSHWGEV